jgi:hypothetical protein
MGKGCKHSENQAIQKTNKKDRTLSKRNERYRS